MFKSRRVASIAVTVIAAAGAAWFALRDGGSDGSSRDVAKQDASDLAHASQRAGLCSSANAAGVGLRGEYFQFAGFSGSPSFTRIDTTIDFTDASLMTESQATLRPRSVRWRGWIRPPISGRYRFHAEPGGARVVVASEPMAGPGVPVSASIQLTLGRFYPIAMEVPALDDTVSGVRLEWTAPHGARFIIPRALLYVPTDTAAPAAR